MKSGISLLAIASRALVPMSADDAAIHREDMLRTRITPGADPRAEWMDSTNDAALREWRDSIAVFETREASPRLWEFVDVLSPNSWLTENSPDECRYVPCDVVRWRDPEHRAALIKRASAYAALVPGCRATMPVEELS